MTTPPNPMEALHKIREQFYEETKDLSLEEWLEKIHQEAQETITRYHLHLKIQAPAL